MKKSVINVVYDVLLQIGAVSSESEFSREWLGRSECYLRTLRFKGAEPSVATIAICASKLQHYGQRMQNTDKHMQLGKQFEALSERCHKQINATSEAAWLC